MEIDKYDGIAEAEAFLSLFFDRMTDIAKEDGSYIVSETMLLVIIDLIQISLYIQEGHLEIIGKHELMGLIEALPESKLLLKSQLPEGFSEKIDKLVNAMSDGNLVRLNRLRDQGNRFFK